MSYNLPSRKLVSQQDAALISPPRVPRSRFINTWTRKTNFDPGWLIPILIDEVLPADHLEYQVTAYIRMQTAIFPQFDSIRIDTFFFFIPARLVWQNWQKFMGEQKNPGDSINYLMPQCGDMPLGGAAVNSIFDHMGIPVAGQVSAGNRLSVNALPLRAYNLVFNEWFRDQNLSTATVVQTDDGPDTYTNYNLKRRARRPDYFTSALPWPQKFTAPTISLGTTAPLRGFGVLATGSATAGPLANVIEADGTGHTYTLGYVSSSSASPNDIKMNMTGSGLAKTPLVYADLAAASGISINTLRQAWAIQQYYERNARTGTRYIEIIKGVFGVDSPDARLQRPEYIGGGQTPLNITPVAQTVTTTGTGAANNGALSGVGTAAGTHRASYAATEHGYILGLINATVDQSYQQGLHLLWTRYTRLDFYVPDLAGLGEQAILTREIYADGSATDTTVFGYQERWQELRTRTNEVVGIMRSTAAGTLDAWHLAQKYTSAPLLNNAFIEENDTTVIQRILAGGAATAGMAFLADIMYRRIATRPIPTYGTPSTLGRF